MIRAAAISMPGQALVAAGERDERVEALGVHHALDGVGDDLARHERAAHALVTHRDAVGDRDRHELEREAARVAHAVLGPLGQPVERHVARRDLVPRRRHADLRLAPVGVGHADRAQHRPGRGTRVAVGDLVTTRSVLLVVGHGASVATRALGDRPARSDRAARDAGGEDVHVQPLAFGLRSASRSSRAGPSVRDEPDARRPRARAPVRRDPPRRAPRRSGACGRRARARHRRHRVPRRSHRSRPARRRARRAAARAARRAARRRARDREALPRHHRSGVPPPAEPAQRARRSPCRATRSPTPSSTRSPADPDLDAILDLRRADERAKDPEALVAGLDVVAATAFRGRAMKASVSFDRIVDDLRPDARRASGRPQRSRTRSSSTSRRRPRGIVELGVGTGLVALPLTERGYTVLGVDLSPKMIAVARDRIGAAGRDRRRDAALRSRRRRATRSSPRACCTSSVIRARCSPTRPACVRAGGQRVVVILAGSSRGQDERNDIGERRREHAIGPTARPERRRRSIALGRRRARSSSSSTASPRSLEYDETPREHAEKIRTRSWSGFWEIDDETWARTGRARDRTAARAPEPDRPRRAAAIAPRARRSRAAESVGGVEPRAR